MLAAVVGFLVLVLVVQLARLGVAAPSASMIVIGRNPLVDQPAPEISLTTVDGRQVSLSSLRGRPVIVNFWASWCIPCREEFPLLVDAYTKYSGQGLEILGVIHDDDAQAAAAFAATYGAKWPLLVDDADVAWNAYNGSLLPVSYYIDRSGIIRAVSYGPPPSGFLDEQIRKIL